MCSSCGVHRVVKAVGMATTRAVARARSDVAAAADEVQRARAAGPERGRSSSSGPRAADRSPPRRMPTRSLAAGLSLVPADDDDDDGEQKAAAEDDDDDGVQAEVDAFAKHGIDESNSESDDEQLARSRATVDLDDEPEEGPCAWRTSHLPARRHHSNSVGRPQRGVSPLLGALPACCWRGEAAHRRLSAGGRASAHGGGGLSAVHAGRGQGGSAVQYLLAWLAVASLVGADCVVADQPGLPQRIHHTL